MADTKASPDSDATLAREIREGFQEGLTSSPAKPDSLTAIAERGKAVQDSNAKNWQVAQQFGITEDVLKARHPEIERESQELDRQAKSAVTKGKWVTGLSGAVGAAIPLALKKPGKWWARGLTAIVTGAIAAGAGLFASFKIFGKPVAKKAVEVGETENKALQLEIGAAVVNARTTPEGAQKEFAASVAPRDASFASQAARDAAQLSLTTAIGK